MLSKTGLGEHLSNSRTLCPARQVSRHYRGYLLTEPYLVTDKFTLLYHL